MLNNKLHALLVPILTLVVVVALLVAGGQFGYRQVNGIRMSVQTLEANVGNLENKLSSYRDQSAVVASGQEAVYAALPLQNSSLSIVSHARNKAQEYDVEIKELTVTVVSDGNALAESSGYNEAVVFMNVSGNAENLLDFTRSLGGVAPLLRYKSFLISDQSGDNSVSITAGAYWAPTGIGNNNTDYQLSDFEKNTITKLEGLQRLETDLAQDVPPVIVDDRVNPFETEIEE